MGISVTKLLIVLAIILVFFGTKRLRSAGSDLGAAIKSFRTALKEGEADETIAEENETNNAGEDVEKNIEV